ncbi:hypothetical protein GGR00_005470 [Aminobacter aganoensis]|uniref:DUF4747 family protein n=2 Tax=Aminobacter aganoensis TaxID=83264 RepID=A0A7X0FDB9_9HYPH|nr:hypothetical protein [Aminobacter aganoensis]
MARKVKVSASALNVRLHPHSPEIYMQWMQSIYSKRLIAQVHGDRHGMISSLDRSGAASNVITGAITTFVKFDGDGNWFNSEHMAEATDEDISEINIPHNLFPNAAAFYFYFDVQEHKIYFQTYSKGKVLTAGSALRFFNGLSVRSEVANEFGEAKITIVQDKSSLESMFAIKRIKEINIKILKPNTDIFDDNFESNIEKHLESTGSREFSVSYKSEGNGSIKPDDDIKKISKVALENGTVEVVGRDERGAVRLNSENFPKELHDRYDPEQQSERSAFFGLIPARRNAGQ